MLFNSLQFLVFFPVSTGLFYLLPHRFRWSMLLAASCIFYMAFIPAYILILAVLIVIDYSAGLLIERARGRWRSYLLVTSVLATCTALLLFKYFDFYAVNITALAGFLHWNYHVDVLNIVLPIGLSFHTFQSLAYVIEVYRGNFKAERHIGIYALYVMFYPQLVAGPIERPGNLLPQFRKECVFESQGVIDGLKLMVWGLFQKVVIADRLAPFVNTAFADTGRYGGPTLLVATVFFSFQIYCDFSGYSDIARGAARTMGFHLMRNFDRPYLATSISEFWSRWHISLTSWFRDYIYIPLGGNRVTTLLMCANLMITFLICGLWHGARWTFVAWGALNGALLIAGAVTRGWQEKLAHTIGLAGLPGVRRLANTMILFSIICAGWILFRADTLHDAGLILKKIIVDAVDIPSIVYGFLVSSPRLSGPDFAPLGQSLKDFYLSLALLVLVMLLDAFRGRKEVTDIFNGRSPVLRWLFYYFLVLGIMFLGKFGNRQFIYFQF